MATFTNEYFGIEQSAYDEFGALNVSIINDLPLFIDPFLLFHSQKQEYIELHYQIIKYLIFLRNKAAGGHSNASLLKTWYCFPEIKQNWLGFSVSGNGGTGLGINFAKALHGNLHLLFSDFGTEKITEGSHLEKVCLIAEGVGRDNISDFTTNLIVDYLCIFTEEFAKKNLKPEHRREVHINRAVFNYQTEAWQRKKYILPWINGDFVILTPKDMLTRDDNWINKGDLIRNFEDIPTSITDTQLRTQVFNYFKSVLVRPENREPNATERSEAAVHTLLKYPVLIDYYIKLKELAGDRATDLSSEKVIATEIVFIQQLAEIQAILNRQTSYYKVEKTTYLETHARLTYLKDVIENKGGHKLFYHDGVPITRESDLQILFRLVWFGTPSDAGTEANDGRGPVDFKISRGAKDKTLVEMKLAKNTQLERNLAKQLPIYQAASDAQNGIKAIIFFHGSRRNAPERHIR